MSSTPQTTGERLPQEWDLEGPDNSPNDDDILARLDRIERRLDAFESTCYTFLLYAKQLSDRTVSFFEDIFGLGREDLAQIHDRLGVNYNNKGDYPQAIASFQKLTDLNRTASACYKLGVASDNNGDFEDAIEALRNAIGIDAHYLPAYYKLAEVYTRTENFGEAVRCLIEAASEEPDNAETHYRLGGVHNARGSYDDAITSFNRVVGFTRVLGLLTNTKTTTTRPSSSSKSRSDVSIRSLTNQILTEAEEDRRRIEEFDAVQVPTTRPDEPQDATRVPKVGLIDRRDKPHPIPGGIAARFKIRQAVETFVKEASLPAPPPPEASNRSEAEPGGDADTAPITIELQSH